MNLNGKKFDAGKTEWDLLPLGPVEEVVKVLMHGREKYGRDNWQLVDNPIRRYYAAAQRHLAAFRRAWFDTRDPYDAIDAESHLHHLAHAACCILFLLWHERKELCQADAAGAILDRLVDSLAAARTKATIDLFETEMSAVRAEATDTPEAEATDTPEADATDTPEADAEFVDALNTLRDLGVIREAISRKPVLIREITDEIKIATYDQDALDKLTGRDVPEIERKAFGAVDKGKDSFKVKGIKFWRVV